MNRGFNLSVRNLNKDIGKRKRILNNVSFDIRGDEFIAIVGVSGAGKTTLLNMLSGYDKPTSGNIYIDNIDYLNNFNHFRGKVGYVPQNEILHPALTLYDTLFYAAKLRLKEKINKKEIDSFIDELLIVLELNGHEKTLIKNLSGGERKRVSIAVELLTKPNLIFLDEPTSGLDFHIEKKLMEFLKKLSIDGTTIIITAHTIANLHLCDRIIFIGDGGRICYIGNYNESLKYFEVDDFTNIYELLKNNTQKYSQMYTEEYEVNKKEISELKIDKKEQKVNFFNKLVKEITNILTLSERYIKIIFNNKIFAALLFLQAIIIAYLTTSVLTSDILQYYDKAKIMLFTFAISAIWIGLFNSVQEIVKERNILKKEYLFNLNLFSYISSKLLVLGIISFVQSVLFMTVVAIKLELPSSGLIFNSVYIDYTISFFLTNICAMAIGLFISSMVRKTETTLIIAPLYMIMQLVFSGALMSLNGIGEKISYTVISKYAYEVFGTITNLIEVVKTTKINNTLNEEVSIMMFLEEAEKYFLYTKGHVIEIWLILIFISVALVLVSLSLIKINILKVK